MQKSLAVANWFVSTGINNNRLPTQMQLQKFIYFAHGWNLAIFDKPLVNEEFQAWKFGPVLESVYHEFKNFGVLGINALGTELDLTPDGNISFISPFVEDSSGNTTSLLNKIWDVFGKYSGNELSKMTHVSGSPWVKAREGFDENARNIAIPNKLIKDYFTQLQSRKQ